MNIGQIIAFCLYLFYTTTILESGLCLLLGKNEGENHFFSPLFGIVTYLTDLFSDGQHDQPESRGDGIEAQHSVRVLRHGH